MAGFIDKVWVDYPVPKGVSIWSKTDASEALEDINVLLDTSVSELASDLLVTEYMTAQGMTTILPVGTVSIVCAKLYYPFQGNRYVKFTYDASTRACNLRFFPAVITFRRKLATVDDLDNLEGDELRFAKLYVLYRMATKELQVLKVIKLDSDNGELDLSALEKFADESYQSYQKLKEEIIIYTSGN